MARTVYIDLINGSPSPVDPTLPGDAYDGLASFILGESGVHVEDLIVLAVGDPAGIVKDPALVTITGIDMGVNRCYIQFDANYEIDSESSTMLINVDNQKNVTFEGMHVVCSRVGGSGYAFYVGSNSTGIEVLRSKAFRVNGSGGIAWWIGKSTSSLLVENSFASYFEIGIEAQDAILCTAYNNTISNCETGIETALADKLLGVNNIITNCSVASTSGTWAAGSDYNSTDLAAFGHTVTGGGNANDEVLRTITYLDLLNGDLHIDAHDTGVAQDLSVHFTVDIDNITRDGVWNRGADQLEILLIEAAMNITEEDDTAVLSATSDADNRVFISITEEDDISNIVAEQKLINYPGIPQPPFNFLRDNPVDPPEWPAAENSLWYYVDPTDVNATDTANVNGYPDKPRLTIPSNTQFLVAGNVVVIGGDISIGAGATPANPFSWYFYGTGTEQSPVWLLGRNNAVISSPASSISISGSYVFLDGVIFSSPQHYINVGGRPGKTDRCVVRNCSVIGDGLHLTFTTAIGIGGASDGLLTEDCIAFNNEVSYCGQWEVGAPENDFHAFRVNDFSKRTWLIDNKGHHCGGDGVQVGLDGSVEGTRAEFVYIAGNDFHHNMENAVDIKSSQDVIVSSNSMHDFANNFVSSDGTAFVAHSGFRRLWCIFNNIYNSEVGIRQSSAAGGRNNTDFYMLGNNIHDVAMPVPAGDLGNSQNQGQVMTLRGASTGNFYFVDNTCWNYDWGIGTAMVEQNGFPPADTYIYGNTFSGRAYAPGTDYSKQDPAVDNHSATLDYNLFEDFHAYYRIDPLNGFVTTDYTTHAQWRDAHVDEGIHDVEGDPLLIDPANGDFSLQAASPAINVNIEHDPYAIFEALYGLNIRSDIANNARPQAGAWDLGANEAVLGGSGAPIVNAGGPYSGTVSTPIQLAATAVAGADPAPVLIWSIVSGGTGTFSDSSIEDPTFTPDAEGAYVLQLSVDPNDGVPVLDTATLASEAVLIPPSVVAGGPYSGTVSTPIQLAATVTPGTDASPVLLWTIVSGGTGTFSDSSIEDPTFTPDARGIYVLQLSADPAVGVPVTDTANLTSEAVAPTVVVGGPFSGAVSTPIQLISTVTEGDDPSPVLFWSILSGGTGTFSNSAAEDPTFTPDAEGAYVLQLSVDPNDGLPVIGTADLTSEAAGGVVAPTVDAGGPYADVAAGDTIQLNGTVVNGTAVSPIIEWTAVSYAGPVPPTFGNPSTIDTWFLGEWPGDYVIQLSADPDDGLPVVDTVAIHIIVSPTISIDGPYAGDVDVAIDVTGSLVANEGTGITQLWSSSKAGVFADPTALITTFTPTEPGLHSIRLTINGNNFYERFTTTVADISVIELIAEVAEGQGEAPSASLVQTHLLEGVIAEGSGDIEVVESVASGRIMGRLTLREVSPRLNLRDLM